MSTSAWPFLVSRGRTAGHREVVIPGFMAGTPLEPVLSLAAGADETADGHAVLREIRSPDHGPLSVVFRVFRPAQSHFGLGGDRPLLDGSSRPILAAEGLVIRRSARACQASGLTRTDLEHAHVAVVPAYQLFWHEENEYRTQTSRPIRIGAPGTPLILHRAQPWEAPAPPPAPAPAARPCPAPRRSRHVPWAAALTGIALIAAGIGSYLSLRPPPGTAIGPLGADVTGCTDITHTQRQPGVTAARQCGPAGTTVTVRIFRFGTSARYQAALAAQARHRLSAASAGTTCPPAPQHLSGAIAWAKPSRHLPAHPRQTLYCWQPATGEPTYLWTAPSTNSYAEATAPTFTDLQHWWHQYNPPDPKPSAASKPP